MPCRSTENIPTCGTVRTVVHPSAVFASGLSCPPLASYVAKITFVFIFHQVITHLTVSTRFCIFAFSLLVVTVGICVLEGGSTSLKIFYCCFSSPSLLSSGAEPDSTSLDPNVVAPRKPSYWFQTRSFRRFELFRFLGLDRTFDASEKKYTGPL